MYYPKIFLDSTRFLDDFCTIRKYFCTIRKYFFVLSKNIFCTIQKCTIQKYFLYYPKIFFVLCKKYFYQKIFWKYFPTQPYHLSFANQLCFINGYRASKCKDLLSLDKKWCIEKITSLNLLFDKSSLTKKKIWISLIFSSINLLQLTYSMEWEPSIGVIIRLRTGLLTFVFRQYRLWQQLPMNPS